MLFYNIGSLLKIIVGTSIIYYVYTKINPYKDPVVALSFGFIWIFLIIWGVSFYIFYITQKIFSQKENITIASRSYKLSLLIWLFFMINISLIIMEKWTKILWLIILIVFIFLQILTVKDDENKF